ncbi:MAG: prepilin-type N-terminal cleavage/methylation domain-containing protein [Firmicutes bacterium]|nr:prepilin-type N-terminal cleavage/methylation domain-containing protein [Bacillota bacterium]
MRMDDKGFTLIELLVVIAIIGIIATIAVPAVVNRIEDSKYAVEEINVRLINYAIQLYEIDHGKLGADDVGDIADLKNDSASLIPDYLEQEPADPWGDGDFSYEIVAVNKEGKKAKNDDEIVAFRVVARTPSEDDQ